ncbi:MAG: hypothetical protein GYB50_04105 [Rhodobacteraceae bacterium]|nr:hypothetical protein [Paracoccaceae bacterium]
MALPGRAFFSIMEASARWGATVADIVGWAAHGHLTLVAGISYARAGEQIISGMVEISPIDIMPAIQRYGAGGTDFNARKIRPLEDRNSGWVFITQPEIGFTLNVSGILLTAETVGQFEREHGILRNTYDQPNKFDWEGMYIAAAKRVFLEGAPESQRAFVREMQEWFIMNREDGDAPDESYIRRKLVPFYKALELGNAA